MPAGAALMDAQPEQQPEPPDDHLRCRKCGCPHSYVIYTRRRAKFVLRRRECRHCGSRFSTCERRVGEAN